ncbi:fibrinogen-like YCDxxxxGGGW domain-containing protein [Paraburkholderia sp. EG287A]|uniref:fibrinogen-like YCDxxxxGGGW domain-containing protein n=1 Tax=Paraburkholderia sp. EG287A TaxID=3237012 RepID=UPI0034D2748B
MFRTKPLRRQAGGALAACLLVLALSTTVIGVLVGFNVQQTRSERIRQSREALDKATVKLASLTNTTATNPAPATFIAGTGAPTGGGFLPAGVTPATDAFATPLGYCAGNPTLATDPVYAVISAGPNKLFQTTCAQALAGVRVGDDLVQRVTVSQLYSGFSSISYHGATVQLESQLGSILSPRAGEIRVVSQTGAVYLDPDGTVGNWQPLSGSAAVVGIVANAAGEHVWADGSYGVTCKDYRYPSGLKTYRGTVGDGVYRVQPGGPGAATLPVYCDMTNDGGGWMLFFNGGRNTAAYLDIVNGTTPAATLSPVNVVGAGGTQGLTSFPGFPFTASRIVVVAGDNPSQTAAFYKGVSLANMTSWAQSNGGPEPDTSKAAVCTDYLMTQNCTSRPFDHDYSNNGTTSTFTLLWGVTLTKYGFATVSYQPLHSTALTTPSSPSAGWCSTTGNLNNNAWNDSYGDGHWGNGLQIWLR